MKVYKVQIIGKDSVLGLIDCVIGELKTVADSALEAKRTIQGHLSKNNRPDLSIGEVIELNTYTPSF